MMKEIQLLKISVVDDEILGCTCKYIDKCFLKNKNKEYDNSNEASKYRNRYVCLINNLKFDHKFNDIKYISIKNDCLYYLIDKFSNEKAKFFKLYSIKDLKEIILKLDFKSSKQYTYTVI